MEKKILGKLNSEGALYRCHGILETVWFGISNSEIIERLNELKTDSVLVMGRPVSAYAIAALHLMQEECYVGNDKDVRDLIIGIPTLKER